MSIREVIQMLEAIFKVLMEFFSANFGGEEDAEGTDEPTTETV